MRVKKNREMSGTDNVSFVEIWGATSFVVTHSCACHNSRLDFTVSDAGQGATMQLPGHF